ncbi:MAG: tetratricopeptide repeat protein [Bacteroidales bacterium]
MKNCKLIDGGGAFILLLLLLLGLNMPDAWAQKKKKEKKKAPVEISEETRKQSVQFADGLREFYADDYTNAENNFRAVTAKNNQHDAAYYMLSRIRKASKDYGGAVYYLNEAIKINKNNEWYKIELAEVYDLMGDYKSSAKLWEEICKLKSSNEYYLFSLAEAYLNQDDYLKVIAAYDKIENLVGYNEEITNAKKNIWLYLNNVKNAVGEYDKLIKEFPYEAKYYVMAGNIYQTNNMPDKAITYYQNALKIDPNNALANHSMADYYESKGDSENSFKALLIAFKSSQLPIEEKLVTLKSYLSTAVRSLDKAKIEQSELLAEAVAEAHPESVEGWATIASLKLLQKNYIEAKKYFEKAVTIDRSQYTLWEDYFYSLSQLKDYQSIINNKETVLELFPTNAAMLYAIGIAYYKEAQSEKAIDYLKKALSYSYDNLLLSNIYNALGDIYQDLNNPDEALKNWKMAQKKGMKTEELLRKIGER